jgi:hypothetical protein
MKKYEDYVKEAVEKKLDERFANSSLEHAKVLIKYIFLDAKHSVKILTDSFNEYFYSSLLEHIENFLNKNSNNKLEIIVKKYENNSILEYLENRFKGQVKIVQKNENELPKDKDTGEIANYIVNDNNAYRYEYSDKDLKYGIVEAIANFNNKEEADILLNNFEQIKKSA